MSPRTWPGPDRGELVDVADQEERGTGRQGAHQRLHQQDVDHRRLVDHEEVAGERVLLVALEAAILRVGLEQAVDGLRLDAGGLGQPFGGSARGGTKGDADALGHESLQDRVYEGGLADPRAAGDHQGLARHRQPQRLPLALRERDAALRLEPGYGLVDVDGGPGRRAGGEGAQMSGDVLLGPVQARQEDAAPIPDRVGHHGAVLQLESQRGREAVGRYLQQLGAGA